jgi:hypothetical protein
LLIFLPSICMLDAIGIDKALPNPRLEGGGGGDVKPAEWVYSRLDFFFQTECVILDFFYEICTFFINYAGVSIIQSRTVYPTFCVFRFKLILLLQIML